MHRSIALARLAMNARFAGCLMASEATAGIPIALRHAQRLLEIDGRSRIVTRCQRKPIAVAIPGNAMLHPTAVVLKDQCNRLFARSEGPNDGLDDRVRAARNGHGGWRVRVRDARAIGDLAAVEVFARVLG